MIFTLLFIIGCSNEVTLEEAKDLAIQGTSKDFYCEGVFTIESVKKLDDGWDILLKCGQCESSVFVGDAVGVFGKIPEYDYTGANSQCVLSHQR